ncbi:glycoside hydrolase family 2 protein [Kocuria tytonis]|uniref:Glycoside hydrolase family 2 immunoglobulin-like beta-sandwich domain-containing protein n=1 Tax=Kocuria tytonis TaxID=2054280 RepID=A0A495A0Y0_9MICC|nr:glycoside hydrolase family 2 protein [Kocuria tytonis]RKQ33103.1 hypothetical protein C1C97_011840 [Kocuria tytonis]
MTPAPEPDPLARASWTLHRSDPGAEPDGPLTRGIAARVPGTVSGALRDALGESAVDPVLDAATPDTVWEYRTRVHTPGGPHRFTSAGVATVARLLVAGREVHASDTAFAPWNVTVELPAGECGITLRILPTTSIPVPRKPRARWLSPLVADRSMRWRRTPLTGSIDWPGAREVLGPWGGLDVRPVAHPDATAPVPARLTVRADDAVAPAPAGPAQTTAADISAAVRPAAVAARRPVDPAVAVRTRVAENGDGVVTVRWTAPPGAAPATPPTVRVSTHPVGPSGTGGLAAGAAAPHERTTRNLSIIGPTETAAMDDPAAVDGREAVVYGADLTVPDPRLWWPHGMGEQNLYRVRVSAGDTEHGFLVGFRTVTAEPRNDNLQGLALRVNDVPVFARGAVWPGADPFEVAAAPERTRELLHRLRDAGTTMLRIPGTGCHETEDFHRACDGLGLMVWQDVPLGPLDPPDDPQWRHELRHEVRALAARLAAHPSTAVISGGTEVIQAPVLAGRPAQQWVPEILLHEVPTAVGEAGAQVVVVPSSPCSDAHLDAAQRAHDAARHVADAADRDPGAAQRLPDDVPDHPGAASDHGGAMSARPGAAPNHPGAVPGSSDPAPEPYGSRPEPSDRTPGPSGAPSGDARPAGERAASSAEPPRRSPVDAADGVSHYFGVGAYGRPLEDAVTRGVRFAAEALAFAVPPEPVVVRAQFGTEGPLDGADSAAAWRRGLAHDPGAAWTFEDTTLSYVHRLFLDRDSDPDAGLATPARPAPQEPPNDHARRLEYERAALAHVFQRTFAQWRGAGSACRGALVLSAVSTAPGAGWGVLDVTGRPTAAWYGMRRACAPVAVCFVPAGGDGLPVHVWNDAPEPLTATLRLTVATVRGGCQDPLDVPVTVPAHGELRIRADLADGTFRDLDHAYGFGEREYEGVSAHLLDREGRLLARDVHLSGGPRRNHPADPGLSARWVRRPAVGSGTAAELPDGRTRHDRGPEAVSDLAAAGGPGADGGSVTDSGSEAWAVAVTAEGLARFVALDLPVDAVAEDGYVHVLPGETVHLPVSGDVTRAVRAATRVRALAVPATAVDPV